VFTIRSKPKGLFTNFSKNSRANIIAKHFALRRFAKTYSIFNYLH